jgi:hypothetical protein
LDSTKESKTCSRNNQPYGSNIHCSSQSIEKQDKGKESTGKENKGKISLEIIDGIKQKIIKNVYIKLEVLSWDLKAVHFMGHSL